MKPAATYQKLRGGYYTPEPIGEFLASWAIRSAADEILEPSCGDGVLLRSAASILLELGTPPQSITRQICAVEVDPKEARRARKNLCQLGIPISAKAIHAEDFFSFADHNLSEINQNTKEKSALYGRRFDVVIGNPPFIRYQHFAEPQRRIAFELMNRLGLHPNRLTNAWVPFVAVASQLLKPQGRLAMVVPAELLQVGYTAELRRFLSDHFCRLTLITFRKLVFPEIQQEVVLLCAEKNGGTRTGINLVELNGLDDLAELKDEVLDPKALKPMDHTTEKWTQYFLNHQEIALIRAIRQDKRVPRLGDLASVDVGVVTGLNEFFVLTEQIRKSAHLNRYTRKIVTRSGHLAGIVFSPADWKTLAKEQQRAYLLDAPAVPLSELPESVRRYVEQGQKLEVHKGYKCRIRKLWYVVPSVWVPDAFLLRQIHLFPKLVLNEAKATCTDTIHRVRLQKGVNGHHLALAFLNSLTFAFSEIVGRSYGGGVLELEPREAEQLPIPFQAAARIDWQVIHQLLVQKRIEEVLDQTDQVLLHEGLGMSRKEIKILRGIWAKLRDRRLHRK